MGPVGPKLSWSLHLERGARISRQSLTSQPFPALISPNICQFYICFTYKYIYMLQSIYIDLIHSTAAVPGSSSILMQRVFLPNHKTQSRSSGSSLHVQKCSPCDGNTNFWAITTRCQCSGLHLRRAWLSLCVHGLFRFESMRIFPIKLNL